MTAPATASLTWHWRWVQFPGERSVTLHRVVDYGRVDEDEVEMYGVWTACGRRIERTRMPGLLSRMGAPRCRRCCRAMGVPEGKGNPFNEGIREAG